MKWWDLPPKLHRGEPPLVVIPLAVAFSEVKQKYRLCCDARYVNLWLKYRKVRFEGLHDLLGVIRALQNRGENDVLLCLSDMKSGYHHVPVAPEAWTYLAIVIDEEYYVFPAVSFGMAIAVEAYCAIENEKHRCLRQLGVRLVQYIDDRASPYTSRGSALFFETHIVKLVSALGGYLSFGKMSTDSGGRASFSKMQLFPLQTGEFLGLQIDTAASRVSIPEKKLTYFERICDELLGKPSTSAREKAKFVGLVVSFMPAVIPAKLFVKRMFAALGNVLSWDDVFETPEEETAVIRRYREHLRTWNGQSWTRLPVKLTLCGDASVELGAAFEVESTL